MLSPFGRARYGPDGFHMLGESDRLGPHGDRSNIRPTDRHTGRLAGPICH